MQPPILESTSSVQVGSFFARALSSAPTNAAPPQSGPLQPQGNRECILRHISADPYLTSQTPLSADEHRWATLCHIRTQRSDPLPEWATCIIASITAATVDQVGPSPSAPESSGSAVPTAATAPSTSASVTEVLRHPDPSTSVDELRWRDYQALKQGRGVAPGTAPTVLVLSQPLVNGGLGVAGSVPLPAAHVAFPVPQTPVFPTPVRTLFPPTPAPADAGLLDSQMDLSDALDPAGHFKCIYVAPDTSLASPEEMRLVQMESYKAGRQVVPYWMVR